MIKKRGRPQNPLAKTDRVFARFTKEEMNWLKILMEKTGKSKSEVLAYAVKITYNLLK